MPDCDFCHSLEVIPNKQPPKAVLHKGSLCALLVNTDPPIRIPNTHQGSQYGSPNTDPQYASGFEARLYRAGIRVCANYGRVSLMVTFVLFFTFMSAGNFIGAPASSTFFT